MALDTNVLVAALRSTKGASYRLLMLVGDSRWQLNLSVPLVFEYEQAAKRRCVQGDLTVERVDKILEYLCACASLRPIFFLWRPMLPDPKDHFVLELAVESRSDFIITFNKRDFVGADQFGIAVVTPVEFLARIGEGPT